MASSSAAIAGRESRLGEAGRGGFLRLMALITIPALVLDQLSKSYVRSHLTLYETIPIVPRWFDITYTLNPGAAFSTFVNAPPWFRSAFLFVLSAIAIVVLVFLLIRDSTPNLTSVSLALILAGACGNLLDRVRFGRVVDFIDVHYYAHHYPIFNLADSAISIGVMLILVNSLFARPSR